MPLRRGLATPVAVALAAAASVLPAPSLAAAATGDIIAPQHPPAYTPADGWQAGTCKQEPPESVAVCSVATPGQFFERAAAHPNWGFTQFIVKHETVGPLETPVGELKEVRVDLPVGLSVNPGAAERCPLTTFEASAASCPPGSQVGESAITASLLGVPTPPSKPVTQVPVYNVVPPPGEPARFGLELAGNEVFLKADLDWAGDYHEGFTIAVPQVADLEPLVKGLILKNRLVFDGRAGDGTFITTPSTCLGEASPGPSGHAYSTYLLAGSWAEAAEPGYEFPQSAEPPFESPIPQGTSPKECDTIPYEPGVEADPNTAATDSPSGATVAIHVPHLLGGGEQDSSDTRDARVTLPAGMGINPSAANGLEACSDAQFGKGTTAPVACPPESKIGTVTIEAPPLPEGNLEGDVYVGSQLSRDPTSGQEYRIFVDAESAKYGISARLIGNVSADPRTGQLTTTFAENPQVPFTDFRLHFDPGARAVLSSPPTCGPNATATQLTPWSANPAATPSDSFALTSLPAGGPCPKTMAARPFAPGFSAGPADRGAKTFTPFVAHLSRPDGQQELKGVDITLPEGATAKLAGVPYCPPAAIADAAGRAGAAERKDASCPDDSQIGVASVQAGTGPSPLEINGKAYLAGPYEGARLSLVVITPAVAGPFDLGTVVVRVPLFLDPETARINPDTNAIPDVFGGARLDVRSIFVNVNRREFALTGTNCRQQATAGALEGGGADPTSPAAFSAFKVSDPFQSTGCRKLKFRPRLKLRLFGATHRAQHPRLRAALRARSKDADVGRASVALPHALFLDQASLGTICTRVQFAAEECPKRSIYGHARAFTPLLGKPLEGPVLLRSSSHTLPDMVAHLEGQVDVDLVGRIDSYRGGIRTTFDHTPDVPVTKFVLTLPGGKHGLLVASRNLCEKPVVALVQLKGQNGRRANRHTKLRTPCGGRKGARKGAR
jgi:hypothetical protein